jgi:hypothetical protein
MENGSIQIIRAGGTFESEHYPDAKNPPEYVKTLKGSNSLMAPTVARLRNGKKVDIREWSEQEEERFNKDSKKFTAEDIAALAQIIRQDTQHHHFILTHGTDDLALNAEMLQKELGQTDKTVVLVATMVPLSMHSANGNGGVKSDGIASLDFALGNIPGQPPGVYIVGVNAKTGRRAFYDPAEAEKDRDASLESLEFTLRAPSRH